MRPAEARWRPTLRAIHAGGSLARTITLVRHGETVSNVSGRWQGQSDSPLSGRGRLQVERLGRRMAGRDTALLVTSDLGRTRATGASIGNGEPLSDWREYDLGAWDGLRPAEIRRRYPDITSGRFGSGDFQPEGGERFSGFTERVRGAFEALASRIDDGQEAIAVTHGGVIQTIVGSIIGAADQSVMLVPSNASLTTVRLHDDRAEVFSLNDDLHLNGDVARPSGTRLRFIRHGETEANLEHRWWGRGESQLSDEGRRQASALAQAVGAYDALASSPSARARETAAAVARDDDTIRIVDDLVEMHFGEWEGLTGAEAQATDPEAFRRIFEEGRDEPRQHRRDLCPCRRTARIRSGNACRGRGGHRRRLHTRGSHESVRRATPRHLVPESRRAPHSAKYGPQRNHLRRIGPSHLVIQRRRTSGRLTVRLLLITNDYPRNQVGFSSTSAT